MYTKLATMIKKMNNRKEKKFQFSQFINPLIWDKAVINFKLLYGNFFTLHEAPTQQSSTSAINNNALTRRY